MDKQEALRIADRNARKADIALRSQLLRSGITEKEKSNLENNLEYAIGVRELIATYWI